MICKSCGCRLEINKQGVRCTYCDFEHHWAQGFCDSCEKMRNQTIRFGEAVVCKECLEGEDDVV